MDLQNKKILLGVSGSIAAYKSPDLVRRLKDRGADVRVVLTSSAEKLVSPTVFQAVSGEPVRGDLWDEQAEAAMGHIELAKWADLVVIAPATANVVAQLANGSADSLLSTLCLATEAPIVIVPSMNQAMYRNHTTQANLNLLAGRNVRFIGPDVGDQACGDVGPGRMTEPAEIVAQLTQTDAAGALRGVKIMVTAGPTREPIDPVRFVSNRSSGKMGFAVARAAADAGAEVTLIAGPVSLPTPPGVERVNVETALEMFDAAMCRISGKHIYIGAAAISDYRPETVPLQKIKKHNDKFVLEMAKSPDLLASIAALDSPPFTVGFAAETERLEEHAVSKLERKKLDMIVANLVGDNLGFDRDDNAATVLWASGREPLPNMSKSDLSRRLIGIIAYRFHSAE
ncbi:MAG: bifunctional phosphopantothenoylcysteine decarboxylase/phosphopantothenate--cysteine ligase CoaBC [Gammaproteobacteria bacterium]|nr:bifunctional phosphopantothenoylcysteine decarboxylase/phosphopantothenate--cysteine ligase CoaBC [Gammaproteobacteria bacterium]